MSNFRSVINILPVDFGEGSCSRGKTKSTPRLKSWSRSGVWQKADVQEVHFFIILHQCLFCPMKNQIYLGLRIFVWLTLNYSILNIIWKSETWLIIRIIWKEWDEVVGLGCSPVMSFLGTRLLVNHVCHWANDQGLGLTTCDILFYLLLYEDHTSCGNRLNFSQISKVVKKYSTKR